MALTTCRECGHQVSTKAAQCPGCGAPAGSTLGDAKPGPQYKPELRPAFKFALGATALLVAIVAFKGPNPEAVAAEAAHEAKCRADLQCAGDKFLVEAAVYCSEPVERQARHAARWTDATLEPRFSRFRWTAAPAGSITFIGDRVEFQNGFGAFTPMTYECDLNPETNQVLNVRVSEGRLPA